MKVTAGEEEEVIVISQFLKLINGVRNAEK
jgi:hypothetical protein